MSFFRKKQEMTMHTRARYRPVCFMMQLFWLLVLPVPGTAQSNTTPMDCQHPPREAELESILPCVLTKKVTIVDASGRKFNGRLRIRDGDTCANGSACELQLRSWFRKEQVPGSAVRSIRYRPPASRKRKALGWVVGAGVACGVTAALLAQGSGEGIGSATFVFGPLFGIPLGGIVGEANSVTVQIDTSRP